MDTPIENAASSIEEDFLWEVDALIAATNGRPVGKLPEGIIGISIDTRTLQKGEAYFAIKGDHLDGHDFVSNAMKAGAGLAVVSQDKLVSLGGLNIPLLVVGDVLEAMRQLGMASRARSKAKIIAVTGSVGKTTTKEMLRTVLGACGKVHASVASFNNHWGVPLTLARMPRETRFGIFEIGMNQPDEIRPLVKQVRPHIAMINNVAAAHFGAFNSLDEIAQAKAEIFEGLVADGYGLINRDDERFGLLSDLATSAGVDKIMSFGSKRGSDFRLKSVVEGSDYSELSISIRGKSYKARLNIPGRHLVQNILGVLGAANLAGADMKTCLEAVSEILPEKGRGLTHTLGKGRGKFLLIDESYNANPASMESAIATLGARLVVKKGRRIAVLGDMLELGETSPDLHRDLVKPIEEAEIDLVFTVGDEISVLGETLPKKVFVGHFKSHKTAMSTLTKALRADDVIMLKASNGLRFAELANALCKKFPLQKAKPKKSKKAGK